MFKINQNLVAIFLAVIFLWWVCKPSETEGFDEKTVEFVPVGSDRYGLRGEELRRSDIDTLYIKPDREIRLNHNGGQMWISNNTPAEEGDPNCRKVKCPCNTEYDNEDTCWKCGDSKPEPWNIPPMHSH